MDFTFVLHLIFVSLSAMRLQMDELACFVPGMLALGSVGNDDDQSKKYLSLAEEVVFISF